MTRNMATSSQDSNKKQNDNTSRRQSDENRPGPSSQGSKTESNCQRHQNNYNPAPISNLQVAETQRMPQENGPNQKCQEHNNQRNHQNISIPSGKSKRKGRQTGNKIIHTKNGSNMSNNERNNSDQHCSNVNQYFGRNAVFERVKCTPGQPLYLGYCTNCRQSHFSEKVTATYVVGDQHHCNVAPGSSDFGSLYCSAYDPQIVYTSVSNFKNEDSFQCDHHYLVLRNMEGVFKEKYTHMIWVPLGMDYMISQLESFKKTVLQKYGNPVTRITEDLFQPGVRLHLPICSVSCKTTEEVERLKTEFQYCMRTFAEPFFKTRPNMRLKVQGLRLKVEEQPTACTNMYSNVFDAYGEMKILVEDIAEYLWDIGLNSSGTFNPMKTMIMSTSLKTDSKAPFFDTFDSSEIFTHFKAAKFGVVDFWAIYLSELNSDDKTKIYPTIAKWELNSANSNNLVTK